MKIKTTRKDIMNGYYNVISVGYCDLYYLLVGQEARYYNCGVYGWNCDIYHINNSIAICTGYRPFGNIKASYNGITRKYNEKARKIWDNYDLDYKKKKAKINKLLEKFINECLELEKEC